MARSVDKIKFGLKLRTEKQENSLTFRIGVKKYALPFEARIVKSDEYLFLHVPPAAEIMKITKDGLVVVTKSAEAEEAVKSFRKSRKKTKRNRKKVALPTEVEDALKKIPAGYKLGYDADGNLKLVKKRTRKKSAAKAAPAKAPKKAAKKPATKKKAKKTASKKRKK